LKHSAKKSNALIYISIIQIILFSNFYSQSLTVNGKVTSSRFPVKDALVTIIDEGDTSKQYSALTDARGQYEIGTITSINSNNNNSPSKFKLGQSYPNPFSSTASIPYGLNKESKIRVTIYDILGRIVRKFNVGQQSVGTHNILWDGRNSRGQLAANGIYIYRLDAGGESQVKKMVFNQQGNGSFVLPGTHSLSGNILLPKNGFTENIQGSAFTIRVENTSNTMPPIVPQELVNVPIQNDTTINFEVTSQAVVTVNVDSLHQIIRGYGAASPWYLPVMEDSEVESAFGMDEGEIGFSIFRITLEADSNRWARYLPATKRAQELGAIIIASPWYAPGNLTEYRNGATRIKLDKYDEYAAYLNSFVKYMERNGVPVYGISVQNEPEMGDWTNWTPDEMFTFMRDHAHAIEGTQVMAPESFQFRRYMSDPILNDSAACANTDIVCGHIYGGGLSKYPLAEEKGKEVWMTEYLMGENNSGNNLYWSIELAQNINDIMEANMNAYVWWTIVRYYGPIGDGQSASDPEDPRERYPDKGEVTKKGYVLSQFSKYIRPGFYRVESSVTPLTNNAKVTAYKDPSSSQVVIVAVNTASSEVEQTFRIQNGDMITSFTPYTTSESKNCEKGSEFNVTDGSFNFTLDSLSVTTFVSE